MRLWHCTPRVNEEAIDRDGLCPQFIWTVRSDGRGLPASRRWQLEPIHVSEDVSFEDFIADLLDVDEVVVYEVKYADLTLYPGGDGLGTFTIRDWVAPDRLRKDRVYDRRTAHLTRSDR